MTSPRCVGATLLALGMLIAAGCSSEGPPAVHSSESTADAAALPPQQMRSIIEGLHADSAARQYSALRALEDLPDVAESQRETIERLRTSGAGESVRRKATEVLAALDEIRAERMQRSADE